MCYAQVDQTRFLVPADDVDRTAQRALRVRQKFACVLRHSKSVGRDRAHGGWMHAREALAKALQAFNCGFHCGGLDSSVAVEAGAEAQRLAPRVLPVELAAFTRGDSRAESCSIRDRRRQESRRSRGSRGSNGRKMS